MIRIAIGHWRSSAAASQRKLKLWIAVVYAAGKPEHLQVPLGTEFPLLEKPLVFLGQFRGQSPIFVCGVVH
jgi:hypothetical protein